MRRKPYAGLASASRSRPARRRRRRRRRVAGAGGDGRGRGSRLEQVRVEALISAPTARRPRDGAGADRRNPAPRDRAGRGVRRRQHDRRQSRAVHGRPAAGALVGVRAGAVATAAHRVLVGMVVQPALTPAIVDRLNRLYAGTLAAIPDGAAKTAGIAAGEAAAARDALRAGRGRPLRAVPVHVRGRSRGVASDHVARVHDPVGPSDPNAWVARVEPFVLESTSQFGRRAPTT